ncbi:MAG: dTMP kinase [Chloroflexi bacterium]|nr:dTMP kinase [Chloroflexota bacterium]
MDGKRRYPGGLFVTFEGPEGAGKTTQARRLLLRLREAGRSAIVTREPGGTQLGDQVRGLVLPERGFSINARAETLLYCVARAQLVDEIIRPALADGLTVISDRYADSTLAYQVFGRGLDQAQVYRVLEFATGGLRPDVTFMLDLSAVEGLERKRSLFSSGLSDVWNRYEQESLSFHERIREGYRRLVEADPRRWRVIDASAPADDVEREVWAGIEHVLTELDAGTGR